MLTQEQQARRLSGLGASEVPAVLGLDPYRSPLDVYLEKTGVLPPFEGNNFTEWGNRQYLKVFNFLWRVKRVEFALSSTWRKCMTGSRGVLQTSDEAVLQTWKSTRGVLAEMVVRVAEVVAQRPFPSLRRVLRRRLHVRDRLLVPGDLLGGRRVDGHHHVQRVDREVVEPRRLRLLGRRHERGAGSW